MWTERDALVSAHSTEVQSMFQIGTLRTFFRCLQLANLINDSLQALL